MLDWNSLPRPIVALAPMADMTDLPFCLICKGHGAPILFREMVSAEAIVRQNPKTLEMARLDDRERPVIQQIFGSDPAAMAEAARIIEEKFHPDGIDVNMGCPVYKIVSNFDGAALMREPERASAIITAMKTAVNVPISVKTRLGWSRDTEILDFVKVIEDAGADLVSIHGRTKEQGYGGTSNWDRIGEAKRNTSLPVLLNGDVTSAANAEEALARSGADGVLIGRGALGNPWIFREIEMSLDKNVGAGLAPAQPITGSDGPGHPQGVPLRDRISVVKEHARLHLARYGERGMVTFRKHLAYYFKKELRHEYPRIDWNDLRANLVRVSTMEELDGILSVIGSSAETVRV